MLVGCAPTLRMTLLKRHSAARQKPLGDPTRRIAEPASHGRNRPSGENRTDGHRLINCRLVMTSLIGPSRTSHDVRFYAAVGGQADIKRAVNKLPDLMSTRLSSDRDWTSPDLHQPYQRPAAHKRSALRRQRTASSPENQALSSWPCCLLVRASRFRYELRDHKMAGLRCGLGGRGGED